MGQISGTRRELVVRSGKGGGEDMSFGVLALGEKGETVSWGTGGKVLWFSLLHLVKKYIFTISTLVCLVVLSSTHVTCNTEC